MGNNQAKISMFRKFKHGLRSIRQDITIFSIKPSIKTIKRNNCSFQVLICFLKNDKLQADTTTI